MKDESYLRDDIKYVSEQYSEYAGMANCRFVTYVKIEDGVASVALMDDEDLW